jgi:hypothetical protein
VKKYKIPEIEEYQYRVKFKPYDRITKVQLQTKYGWRRIPFTRTEEGIVFKWPLQIIRVTG